MAVKRTISVRIFSLRSWNRRGLLIALSVLVIGVAAGRLTWGPIRHGLEQVKLFTIGGGVPAYTSSPAFSKEYNATMDWLLNDLGKSSSAWTIADAQRLLDIMDERITEEYVETVARRKGASANDQERLMKFRITTASVSERLRRNEPIEQAARILLVDALVQQLDDSYWGVRLGAVSSVVYARLVLDPEVRVKVELLYDDPNEQVAGNARSQLAHFDEVEQFRAEGKWREPGIE